VVAERARLTAALRDRGLAVADSQANFVWLPLGGQSAELAAQLESRAVITRPFAGEGVRVTVGTPEEDDVFLAALDEVLAGPGALDLDTGGPDAPRTRVPAGGPGA
jgi:histidinol-phosphate aminotransferase